MSVVSVVRSELTKTVTLPSVLGVTGALAVLAVLFQFQALASMREVLETVDGHGDHWWYGRPVPADLDILASMGAGVFNPGIFFPVLGAAVAGAEFRSGHLGLSVLAVPSRVRLALAKCAATGLYALACALVIAALSLIFAHLAVRDWQPDLVWRAESLAWIGGAVLLLVVITTVAFAVTLIARRMLFGVLLMGGFLVLTLTQALSAVAPGLDALTPFSAGRNLLLQSEGLDLGGPPFSSSPSTGGVVLLAWLVVTVAAAALVLYRRDAR
ncbi:ABC transporter permease [Nocardiopsis sp. NPDC007018]|uniref:ABC transporter permease n=1 Tax=Nocardiopsis sp. NPDC007018 TaxID=3155721 RepID=UPI0033C2CB92